MSDGNGSSRIPMQRSSAATPKMGLESTSVRTCKSPANDLKTTLVPFAGVTCEAHITCRGLISVSGSVDQS